MPGSVSREHRPVVGGRTTVTAMKDLQGKTAVITGAASGMGKAFSHRFAQAGMNVVMSDVEAPRLDGAVAEVASGRSWAELVDEVYVRPCGLDVLGFNNPFTQFDAPPFSYPTGFAGEPGTLVATDNPNMEGGAYVTTGAYGALLLMYLREGRCGDHTVLTPASVAWADSTTATVRVKSLT